MKKKKIEIILGIIIILGIFLLKLNILNEPYYYMEMRNMNWALKQMDEFNLSYDKIHPPGQEIIFAMSWNVLGYSIVSSHSLNIFLGIIGLAYLYLLGKHIVNSRVGLGAVILLIFNQIFFKFLHFIL